ncbi:hypothetical protein [Micromonospora sp. NBC_01796]|uniref:hypothetical protein n=1 Tax=Micromonospora sp. NBC_01796 TaxID=2975987 RepID=UPI002DD98E0D|nr:hypothetical protein [Micromonospora sp. NBC_01796]WSA88531.1 hypothetical protein OIE47_13505 [Micromonospora sp. NBC_01796]
MTTDQSNATDVPADAAAQATTGTDESATNPAGSTSTGSGRGKPTNGSDATGKTANGSDAAGRTDQPGTATRSDATNQPDPNSKPNTNAGTGRRSRSNAGKPGPDADSKPDAGKPGPDADSKPDAGKPDPKTDPDSSSKPGPEAGATATSKPDPSDGPERPGTTSPAKKGDKAGAKSDTTAAEPTVIDLGVIKPNAPAPGPRPPWWRRTWPLRRAGATVVQLKPPAEASAADQPEGDPVDRWSAFAPAPEPTPGRLSRITRVLAHEWTLAGLASLVLAVVLTWPTLRYPAHTIPQDIWDPTLQAWQMSWSGHILMTNPALLWQSNAFYPESWSFAFSDTLLGYAPAGMIGHGPVAALVRYNIIFVLAHALATVGAYALVRQLGAGRIGAAVAGVAFAYPPWLLSQAGHLHIISNGGIPLALAMLARGHGWSLRHGFRPERKHAGWALGGWLVAAWQLSLGFGIGLPFAYLLAVIFIVSAVTWFVRRTWFWPERRPLGVRLLLADFWGAVIFAGIGVLLAIPYFRVAELHPNAKRTVGDLALYSPPPSGFVVAPQESLLWGRLHEAARAGLPWAPENTLLPGFVLYALALAGLFFSIWTIRQRLLLLAGVLVSGILTLGTEFFGGRFTYLPLFEHLPGWDGLRTPGRLMIWTTLLLGILAAGSVSAFAKRAREISAAERIPPRPGPLLRLATLLPLVLVLAEGLNSTPTPIVPAQPAAMRTVDGPVLVLPSDQGTDQHVMLWSTSRFQDVVNGGSGFTPDSLAQARERTQAFPDQESIDYLRGLGVKTVVLLKDRAVGTPWERAADQPVDQFNIRREDSGDTVVFHLDGS